MLLWELVSNIATELDSHRAYDILGIDVRGATSITDGIIIGCGNSPRHVKALANHVLAFAKKHAVEVLGVEGTYPAEWVLIDLNDVIVHLMSATARQFYRLEGLWVNDDNVIIDIQGTP